MPKKGYKEIPIDEETYNLLEQRANELELTVDEYASQLVQKLIQTPIEEVLKLLKGEKA